MSAILMFPALLALILLGFPIALSMISVAFVFGLLQFGTGIVPQMMSMLDQVVSNNILTAIPLFIFMGAMIESSGIAKRLFEALYAWVWRLPGAIALCTILMGTVFAAASGVVGATETVIGLLTVPVMMKLGYDRRLVAGAVCAGGSLGTVIPPSITVIVLAPIANLSVGSLYAGLLLPGLLMSFLFLLYVVVACTWKKDLAPPVAYEAGNQNLGAKLKLSLTALAPTVVLIFAVLGTVLMGIATATESAACGALGAVLLAICYRTFSLAILWKSLVRTVSITAMILLIVLGGNVFAGVFFGSGGSDLVQSMLTGLGLEGGPVVALILAITFLLGFVLDIISITLIVVPLAMPLVRLYGIDPVWFAILFLITLQTSYLTPPMAPSIFYFRAIAPPGFRLSDMYWGMIPFVGSQVLTLLLVILFPALALWLPLKLFGS